MSQHRRAGRGFALGTIVVLAISAMLPMAVSAVKPTDPRLGLHDEQLLAKARIEGRASVTILVAAKGGAAKGAEAAITNAGGTIRYRDAALGYIRADVPTGNVSKIASDPSVEAVDLDETLQIPDPRPDAQTAPTPFPAPGGTTERDNPYMPIGDTGAADFIDAHPTWDGRGVTVGVLDSGITLDHPALTTTTTGEPKITDWVTYTDGRFNADGVNVDNDPTWLNMQAQVNGASFVFNSVSYTAPAAGSYRIAVFNERDPRLGGEVGSDVNRDGNPAGSSGNFAVLWNTTSNTVWVDTNQNNSFADEDGMTDYRVNRDVGFFGTDNPATPVKDSMPFVVQTDGKNKVVNIGIVSAAHGTHVAGIIAANGLFNADTSGAAPGAQIVSVRVCLFIAGCTAHALVEGMIYAAKVANVDVINMSIGGLPSLNDANNARAILYDRLIEQANVQMFISAGNSGPGENTVGDPSVATKVMSVAAYITDATWASNYGSTAPVAGTDNLHPFSSRGPREDGGFKPNISAPGAAISSTPLWQLGGPVAGVHTLPPGLSMFNGTSMAAPQSAGAAALLVSAAKDVGVQHQPAQLRQALSSSADFLDGYGAFEQGAGLIQVQAAWDLLATNAKTVDIRSSVPVDTALEQFLATPGVGVGIHDREGVTIDTPYTRTYTFTRTSGGGGSTTYNLSLTGNDGTFSLGGVTSISLPKGQPRMLTVSINPAEYGHHSAILNLDDPTNPGIEYQTMNTVVVARDFVQPDFSHTITGSVGRNQALSYYFEVPANTPALKVDFSGPSATPGTGQARFVRYHPFGVNIDGQNSLQCYSPPVVPGGSCAGGGPLSRTTSNPQAGVWEITVEARRTADIEITPFTLTVSVLGATVSPNPDTIASATIGVPIARSYEITNEFGAFTGRAAGSTFGSAKIDRPTIANLAQQIRTVTVTAGSTALRATIGDPSDPAADLDLFVYQCTDEGDDPATLAGCTLRGQAADGDSEESVTIASPTAGNWAVLVDGFAVPAGSTQYDYVDVFTNAAFGSVSVTDADALRPAGSSWTVPGTVTANAAPAAGRVLLGQVRVLTSTNILVGSGDVIVESVTP
jgi:subtilisin family serine protease